MSNNGSSFRPSPRGEYSSDRSRPSNPHLEMSLQEIIESRNPHVQGNKRQRLSESATSTRHNSPAAPGTTQDVDYGRLGRVFDEHLVAHLKALEVSFQKTVATKSGDLKDLEEHVEDLLSETYQKTTLAQSEAVYRLKAQLENMYNKTVDSQSELNRGLESQLAQMTRSRDESLNQIESLQAEQRKLRKSLNSTKDELKDAKSEVSSVQKEMANMKKETAKAKAALTIKDKELLKREQELQTHKKDSTKNIDVLTKVAERNITAADKNIKQAEQTADRAERNLDEVQRLFEEVRKDQRQLQEDNAKLRTKDVESKREIRRLLGVIRDAAPDKFREEIMKDHLLDVMF
ncbi:hypothetical protein BJ166DRAFT_597405 [Pestalotiopsis sp. NC0098]|nr:hypothetical protein BJ166DRAFT_597405 [Pestalotiopsis sp. NC0098]